MRRLSLSVLVLLVALPAWAQRAGDIPGASFGSVPVPLGSSFLHLTPGPDDSLWATDVAAVKKIVQLRPPSAYVPFPLGAVFGVNPQPIGIAAGPDGNLWFAVAERRADGSHEGSAIGRLTPDGQFRRFPVPTAGAFASTSDAAITAGPDGNVWFVEPSAAKVGRVTAQGVVTEFPIQTPQPGPRSITSGSDGNLWFAMTAGKIGRVSPGGLMHEFPVPDGATGKGRPFDIAAGPDGQLYFTDPAQNRIGRITPSGIITMFPLPTPASDPAGIVTGADGNVYFALRGISRIGRLALDTLRFTESEIPFAGQPFAMIRTVPGITLAGPDGLPGAREADVTWTTLGTVDGRLGRMTAGESCSPRAPRAPTVADLPDSVEPGGSVRVAVSGAEPDVTLGVIASCLPDASVPVYQERGPGRITGAGTVVAREFLVPTADAPCSQLYVRALAFRGCTPGRLSAVQAVRFVRAQPAFASSPGAVEIRVQKGGSPIGASVQVRNIAAASGYLALSVEGDAFSVTPRDLLLGPGESRAVSIDLAPSVTATPGRYQGMINGTPGREVGLRIPVTITVFEGTPGSAGGLLLEPERLQVEAPAGQNPSPATSAVSAVAPSAQPLPLFVAIEGPGGAGRLLAAPTTVGTQPAPVSVGIDRSLRTFADGPGPWLTRFRIDTGDPAETASLDLWDYEPFAVVPGVPRPGGVTVPAGESFVVPSVVNATASLFGATYVSDGWLRNEDGTSDAAADLLFTPEGKDGLTDPSVLRTRVTVPAGATVRLHDVVGSFLGTTGSGQLEVRSATAGSLSLRSVVEAVSDADPSFQFGGEIPAVASSEGTYRGGPELLVPGVADDATTRTNLILAETSGEVARVVVRLHDVAGNVVGTHGPVEVPPYGKVQVDRIVRRIAAGELSLGTLDVTVAEGAGRVVALATLIELASNSFRAVPATPIERGTGSAVEAQALVLPAVARLTGAYDTKFSTDVHISNGTTDLVRVTLVYRYIVKTTGETGTASRLVNLGPRAALPESFGRDAILNLFGVSEETSGWIRIEGDVSGVAVAASVSAEVDPGNPAKGRKHARIETVADTSRAFVSALSLPRTFTGAEKSSRKRTSLILVETAGQSATVRIRIHDRAGRLVAGATYGIQPYQYRQLTDVFGTGGIGLGDGPFVDATLSVEVVSGGGRIVSVATVNDNVSRNPTVFVLEEPGPLPLAR